MLIANKRPAAIALAVLVLTLVLPVQAAKKSKQTKAAEAAAAEATAPPAPESAQVIRETALKKEPFSDAETTGTLAPNTTVQIVTRQGAWMNVQAADASGWLRLLSLRTAVANTAKGDSGLNAAINVARSGASGNTVATGVRGLSKEQISNATPNLAELEKMAGHASSEASARAFASVGSVVEADVSFLESGDK